MSELQALILGIIQGLAEFLPISSTGHLVIAQNLMKIQEILENALLFDLTLHLGTLLAIIYCYWGDIRTILRSIFKKREECQADDFMWRRLALMFVVSVLVTSAIALPLNDIIDKAFKDAIYAVAGLFVTSIILLCVLIRRDSKGELTQINYLKAALIGLAQGIAVFPGVSRSGFTIVTGRILGIKTVEAARYSFLLSLPTILLACGYKLIDIFQGKGTDVSLSCYLIGFFVSCIFGILAIKSFIRMLGRFSIAWFSIYCVIAGLVFYRLIEK